jgi:hypothetical protein
MRRRLLNLVTLLSLVLCVAVVVLWVRSYFVTEALVFGRVADGDTARTLSVCGAGSGRGRLALVLELGLPTELTPGHAGTFYRRHPPTDIHRGRPSLSLWNRLGFFLLDRPEQGVILPLWVPAAVTTVLPVHRAAAFARARKRRPTGLCPS